MQFAKSIPFVIAISSMLVGIPQAHAQKAACFHMQFGIGYAGWARVVGKVDSPWSRYFAVGETVCQPLAGYVDDGSMFEGQISALLGQQEVPCTPKVKYVAESQATVTFQVWGQTWNVQCKMPQPDWEQPELSDETIAAGNEAREDVMSNPERKPE